MTMKEFIEKMKKAGASDSTELIFRIEEKYECGNPYLYNANDNSANVVYNTMVISSRFLKSEDKNDIKYDKKELS